MQKRDYYEILGVSKSASLDEIKQAYREAALRTHPDRVPVEQKKEAEERFKDISEAYAVLSDPHKRALYDQHGHAGIDQRYAYEDIFKETDFSSVFGDMADMGLGAGFFERLFGDLGFDLFGRRSQKGTRKEGARDLEVVAEITLEEAASGIEKKVSFYRYERCDVCRGSGAKEGGKVACPDCRGSGQQVTTSGAMRIVRTCQRCLGEREIIQLPCPTCQGEGRIRVSKTLIVNVPPGVDTGAALRVRGEGERGQGGQGDLYVLIKISPHPLFQREGANLILLQQIPLTVAVLGGEISVPLLEARATMKIPAGTQNGTVFRLKGKGMPHLQGQAKGDLLVKVEVSIPAHLTPEQKRLMEEFAKSQQP